MITVPSLDPCTDIANTDKVMITHANGTTETMTGALLNKRNQAIISENTTLNGTPLKTGNIVRVLFTADQSANNNSTAFVINYNSTNITVKVCKDGALTNYLPFEVSTNTYKYCQAYTTLELLYDDTNFIILGNPVVLSTINYATYADHTTKYTVVGNSLYYAKLQQYNRNQTYVNFNSNKYLKISTNIYPASFPYFGVESYFLTDNSGEQVCILNVYKSDSGINAKLIPLYGTNYLSLNSVTEESGNIIVYLETRATWSKSYTIHSLSGTKPSISAESSI